MNRHAFFPTIAALLAASGAAAPAAAQIVAGPIQRGNSTYYLVGPTTWSDAEAQAVALGGHLVTINDAAENAWVTATFTPYGLGAFIGFTDAGSEDQWRWTSGAPVTYTNWRIGEPNNESGAEHYGELYNNGQWNDCRCIHKAGVVEVVCTSTPPTSEWTGGGGNFEWQTAGNWTPSGQPAENATARFPLGAAAAINVPDGTRIGQIDVLSGLLTLNMGLGSLLPPTSGCRPAGGSLGIGDTGQMGELRFSGRYVVSNNIVVGYGLNSRGTLSLGTLDRLASSAGILLGFGAGSVGTVLMQGGDVEQSAGSQLQLGVGEAAEGRVTITGSGTFEYPSNTAVRLGAVSGGRGYITLTGDFTGEAIFRPSGSGSQLILGGEAGESGGLTTIGEITMNERSRVIADQLLIGGYPRSRGRVWLNAGTLDVRSLIIADEGEGFVEWSGGSITGLAAMLIGRGAGSSGHITLDGPAQSLTFSGLGGQATIEAGRGGRGRIEVLNGAQIDLTAGATSGLGIGAWNSSGAGSLKVVGANSRVFGDNNSILAVGRTFAIPLTEPTVLLDQQAVASFGIVRLGGQDWMDAEMIVRNGSRLYQTHPGADAFGNANGLSVEATSAGTRLLVESGGKVEATSVLASGQFEGGPIIAVDGAGSTLTCSGAAYVVGTTGGTMAVTDGATMTTGDLYLGGFTGLYGELRLQGPGQILTVQNTLTLGTPGDASSAGYLVLTDNATVRVGTLDLGQQYYITNGTANNPQIMVGGSPLTMPDIRTDTLLFTGSSNDISAQADLLVGTGATIGGSGTWNGDFAGVTDVELRVTGTRWLWTDQPATGFNITGHFAQDAAGTLDMPFTGLFVNHVGFRRVAAGTLAVDGIATIGGTLRLRPWPDRDRFGNYFSVNFHPLMVGESFEVLTAAAVVGEFDAVEVGLDIAPYSIRLTYEPTRVLATIVPPVCEPIESQPQNATTCPGGTAAFFTYRPPEDDGSGGEVLYAWEHLTYDYDAGYYWTALYDGNEGSCVQGSGYDTAFHFQGAATPLLSVTVVPNYLSLDCINSPIQLRCVTFNGCLVMVTNEVTLAVTPDGCSSCPADFNQDGGIDGTDVEAFFSAWEGGASNADVNQDGGIDGADVETFFAAWEVGRCG